MTALALAACGGGGSDGSVNTPAATSGAAVGGVATGLTAYVNPLIGTAPGLSPNPTAHGAGGNTLPAAGLPSGMVQWGPDSSNTSTSAESLEPGAPAGYYYDYNVIQDFSLTHMSGTGGTGNDGEFPILPTVGPAVSVPTFSHSNEVAHPGYYAVTLDNGVKVELTATVRSGYGRFTYPAGAPALVVVNATRTNTSTSVTGSIAAVGNTAIEGITTGGGFEGNATKVPVYMYAEFDQPFLSSSTITNGVADLAFNPGATVQMRVGISYVSIANAKLNLQTENAAWDFSATEKAADAAWEQRLDRIRVTSTDTTALTKFYTAFYHTLWAPSVWSDVNGQYMGFDQGVHTLATGQTAQYSGFSGWDVYRSEMPFRAFLFPTETSDMAQSLVNDADQCGGIPHWVNDDYEAGVMPGDAGSLMVAGAYAYGATNFNSADALTHMIKQANVYGNTCNGTLTNGGRQTYLKYGYITSGDTGIASSTLEYTGSDFAISQFAGALGNTTMQTIIGARSAYWQNEVGTETPPLISGRTTAGAFNTETQTSTGDYDQGSAEQYTYMVPFNMAGLVTALGGNTTVQTRLGTFFSELNAGPSAAYLYIGNEPGFGTPWIYDYVGAPASSQALIQKIVTTQFSTTPGGLPGNDDMGATSSWYVWASLGMYPGIPGVAGFELASPQFSAITITLESGKTIQINASGAPTSPYVSSLSVNGTAQTSTWLPFSAVQNGGTLNFGMSGSASSWGTDVADAPPSYGLPVYANMAAAFNLHSAAPDGSSNTDGTGADFDGQLSAYSSTAMAVTDGQVLSVDGTTFTWGSTTTGLDNAISMGQTVDMPSATGTTLVVLGAANNGPSSGTITLNYTDGTSSTATLTLPDWTNGGAAISATNLVADRVALTSAHRLTPAGSTDTTTAYIYYEEIPLTAGETLASVKLPTIISAGKMHIFGLATK
ncbi:glycoside hydrolase family 92 protein [Pararobbsia silviterrae]|uniref:Glycoside hydrolase family 92 protein n=2 Tax=Pararobbsia silviterrae TaxID=1792498 RepID=A0A494XQ39_9BURK|nr:glycoside hydrolase family 92 protein [Pararobbsia silviterrae]